jgi:predicted small secreted protein
MKKLIISLFTMAFVLMTMNACSTMEGMGKDIQRTGQAIEKEAKKRN